MAPLTAQGSQKRIESRCCQSPKSPISSKTLFDCEEVNSSSLWVLSDVWCWSPDHKHSVAFLSPHQAPHSLSPRGGKCHKPLHWGAAKIEWDWWRNVVSFCRTKISAENWFILSRIIFWVKRHLKEQDLETGPPSPMPGTVRGSIPNGASAPSPLSASSISAITQNCGQKRHHPSAGSWWWQICPPLGQEHVFWKFLTDIDQ